MQNILLIIQAYLFGRLGSRILGLMLVLSLIWWAGPYVGLTETTLRAYLIIGVLVFFVGVWLIRRLVVKNRSNLFRKDLDAHIEQDQSRQAEIEELRGKMNQAIASLKSSELGSQHRGNAALYALPWFMIIGPAAAGKTSLLRNSGLHFPYAHDNDIDIRGFGGTRNCDWWFSNEAVLLDTAGRYTTEQDDRPEWLAFLALLRKHRRRQPLNGAIVAISLADLLTADNQEIERHVKIIRDRIDELTARLGCVFPIYVVFTKCDLLHGFTSYFADLDDKERDQVWGCWLGHEAPQNIGDLFRTKMGELHRRLTEMRLYKLSLVRKIQAKNELFDFPGQFEAAQNRLVDFITRLTKENPYQDTPNFCGIYLTSATQEGTPIQKILGKMRQAFGFVEDREATELPESTSFFVKNFFQSVVFPNAQDVSRTKKSGIIHRTLKTASIVGCLGLIAGSIMLLSTTLTANTLLLKKGDVAAERLADVVEAKESAPSERFSALTEVLRHYQKLKAYEEKLPISLTMGVYEGDRQLPAIRSLLLGSFERLFFQPALDDLEIELATYGKQWLASSAKRQDAIRDDYYDGLKAYLMLNRPDRLDLDEATRILLSRLEKRLPESSADEPVKEKNNRDLEVLLRTYLSHMQVPQDHPDFVEPRQVDQALVVEAQNYLKALPDPKRLYAQIRNKGRLQARDLGLQDMIKGPGRGLLSSAHAVPFMYTAKGWHEFTRAEIQDLVALASRGDWVTGYLQTTDDSTDSNIVNEELSRQLEREIRGLYFTEYAEHWFRMLEETRLDPFRSLDDASKKMLLLARNDGPIAELMQVVSRNINLSESKEIQVFSGSRESSLVPELEAPLHDLRKLADAGDKMNTSLLINQYLLALTSAQAEIEQLAATIDVQQDCFHYAASILGGSGANDSELYKCWLSTKSLLNGIEARTRKVAEQVLTNPIQQAWLMTIEQTRNYLQNQWNSTVFLHYKRKIVDRFPFSLTGSDASLNDVSDFFRPDNGIIWSFTDEQLKPFLRKKRHQWAEKSWLGIGVKLNPSLLRSLTQASQISSGLFRQGQNHPDVHFSIYPIPSRGLRMVRFEASGQQMIYQNEPQEWRHFKWPGDEQMPLAVVGGTTSGNLALGKLDFAGDWSLFHLLKQARITNDPDGYMLAWDLESAPGHTLTVQLKLRPDRDSNIFVSGLFSDFRLPATIF